MPATCRRGWRVRFLSKNWWMTEQATSQAGKGLHDEGFESHAVRLLFICPTALCDGLSIDGTGFVKTEHLLGIWEHKLSQKCKLYSL